MWKPVLVLHTPTGITRKRRRSADILHTTGEEECRYFAHNGGGGVQIFCTQRGRRSADILHTTGEEECRYFAHNRGGEEGVEESVSLLLRDLSLKQH